MHTTLDVDKDKIDKAKILTDAINNNITSFTPDLTMEKLVNNYSSTKNLLGATLVRELTGYDPSYIDKNIHVPEFKRELKERIKQNLEELKKKGLLGSDGSITEDGYEFAALSLLTQELNDLEGKGLLGEKESRKMFIYGERQDIRNFKSGDRYKDIEMKQTSKKTIRRGHTKILKQDLIASDRKAKGKINVVYAIDASGSMKGEKIKVAKKAGIALAYKAIRNNDAAGIIIFSSEIKKILEPGKDFFEIAKMLSNIRSSGETDIALGIEKAVELFKRSDETNHIVLLTDVLQTRGKKPEMEVLKKIGVAASKNITISLIGININKKGEILAKKIVDISNGSFYKVKSLENVDAIILEDYYRIR